MLPQWGPDGSLFFVSGEVLPNLEVLVSQRFVSAEWSKAGSCLAACTACGCLTICVTCLPAWCALCSLPTQHRPTVLLQTPQVAGGTCGCCLPAAARWVAAHRWGLWGYHTPGCWELSWLDREFCLRCLAAGGLPMEAQSVAPLRVWRCPQHIATDCRLRVASCTATLHAGAAAAAQKRRTSHYDSGECRLNS